MTIEEINILQDIVDIYEKEDIYPTLNDKQVRTIKKAIKALEKEDILDKIRAEIMKLQTYKMFVGENTVYNERDDVLEIIDKYRAESGE